MADDYLPYMDDTMDRLNGNCQYVGNKREYALEKAQKAYRKAVLKMSKEPEDVLPGLLASAREYPISEVTLSGEGFKKIRKRVRKYYRRKTGGKIPRPLMYRKINSLLALKGKGYKPLRRYVKKRYMKKRGSKIPQQLLRRKMIKMLSKDGYGIRARGTCGKGMYARGIPPPYLLARPTGGMMPPTEYPFKIRNLRKRSPVGGSAIGAILAAAAPVVVQGFKKLAQKMKARRKPSGKGLAEGFWALKVPKGFPDWPAKTRPRKASSFWSLVYSLARDEIPLYFATEDRAEAMKFAKVFVKAHAASFFGDMIKLIKIANVRGEKVKYRGPEPPPVELSLGQVIAPILKNIELAHNYYYDHYTNAAHPPTPAQEAEMQKLMNATLRYPKKLKNTLGEMDRAATNRLGEPMEYTPSAKELRTLRKLERLNKPKTPITKAITFGVPQDVSTIGTGAFWSSAIKALKSKAVRDVVGKVGSPLIKKGLEKLGQFAGKDVQALASSAINKLASKYEVPLTLEEPPTPSIVPAQAKSEVVDAPVANVSGGLMKCSMGSGMCSADAFGFAGRRAHRVGMMAKKTMMP